MCLDNRPGQRLRRHRLAALDQAVVGFRFVLAGETRLNNQPYPRPLKDQDCQVYWSSVQRYLDSAAGMQRFGREANLLATPCSQT